MGITKYEFARTRKLLPFHTQSACVRSGYVQGHRVIDHGREVEGGRRPLIPNSSEDSAAHGLHVNLSL